MKKLLFFGQKQRGKYPFLCANTAHRIGVILTVPTASVFVHIDPVGFQKFFLVDISPVNITHVIARARLLSCLFDLK